MQPFAFGMEPFNHSVALQLGVMEDMLFNLNYVNFLANPLHAIDIGPKTAEDNGCVKGVSLTPNDRCTRHVLITQEYQNVDATLPLTQHLESRVVLSMDQQVYSLEYRDNIELSKLDLICEDFRSGPGQYRFCTKNEDDGWLQAALIPCPADLVARQMCDEEPKWKSSTGFTTALKANFLDATISYDRQDGRILSHEIRTEPRSTDIKSMEVLEAMKVILNTTAPASNSTTTNPILGSPNHFFGRLIAGHMYRISKIMEENPSARVKGVNAVQSILGMALFYCQNGVLGQTVLPNAPGAKSTKENYSSGAFEKQQKTAMVALARTRYRIEVGRGTLIAYIVLSGSTLLICIIALVIGSIIELMKLDAEPTLWPALDFYTQCRVEDTNGKVNTAEKRIEMAWIHDRRGLFKEMGALRVTRRKRKMRETRAPESPTIGEG